MLNLSVLIPGKTVLVDPHIGKERLYLGRIKFDDIIVTAYNGDLIAWRPSEYKAWCVKPVWKDVTDQCVIDEYGCVLYKGPCAYKPIPLCNYADGEIRTDGMKVYEREGA